MGMEVKGRTITMDTQAQQYPDWVKVREARWQGASTDAACLLKDLDGAIVLESAADQDEFIDVSRPNLWYRGLVLTTLSGTTKGKVTVYTE